MALVVGCATDDQTVARHGGSSNVQGSSATVSPSPSSNLSASASPSPGSSASATATATPDPGHVGGTILGPSASPGATVSPSASAFPALVLTPPQLTLYVPPSDGSTALFKPTAFSLNLAGAVGTVLWKSTNPTAAQVSNQGVVTAAQSGTATISAVTDTGTVQAVVTVVPKARLSIAAAGDLPAGATSLGMTITSDRGSALFAGGATADLQVLGDLLVNASAYSSAGVPVAAGRYLGLNLLAGKLNPVSLPLNQPSLSNVPAGSPGAAISITGSHFRDWLQGQAAATYSPVVSAAIDGFAVVAAVVDDTHLSLSIPSGAGTQPATRSLVITVGGIPLSAQLQLH